MNSIINKNLLKNEYVIWNGRPFTKEPIPTTSSNILFLLWTGFFVFTTILCRLIKGDWQLTLYMIPFFCVSLYEFALKAINHFSKKDKLPIKNSCILYYITNKRILIIINNNSVTIYSIYHKDLTDFYFDHDENGIGNIYSSTPVVGEPFSAKNICLENVENVKNIYESIKCFLTTEQLRNEGRYSYVEDSLYNYLAEDRNIGYPEDIPSVNKIATVAKKMNMATIILLLFIAVYFGIIYFILNDSYSLLIKIAPFAILCSLVFLYQLFTKIQNKD